MRSLRLTLTVLLLLISIVSRATHFSGYDLSMTRLTGDTYNIKFKFYRDVNGTAALPASMLFNIYVNGTNTNVNMPITLTKTSSYYLTYNPADCPPFTANLSLQVGIYEYTLTATQALSLNNPNGYYISSSMCCRGENIKNILNSNAEGIVFTMDFPRLSVGSATRYNNSPRFNKSPLNYYCVGKPYAIDFNATDPDGDSLVFSVLTPYNSNSDLKPFGLCTFNSGYNINFNIMDGSPDYTINPSTGIINFIPTAIGKYTVAIKCDEYRKINGVATKIGSIIRDYQFETVICTETAPVLSDNRNRYNQVVDTVTIDKEYILTLTGRDVPHDSLKMYLIPDLSNNILDTNQYKSKWGEIGFLQSGISAQNSVISGVGVVQGQFRFKPVCENFKKTSVSFKVVVRDLTCPSPLYDTINVLLLFQKENNTPPYIVLGDTIKRNTTKNYFINEGVKFQLYADSVLRYYDIDTLNKVNISMIPDPSNGNINNRHTFLNHQDSTGTWASFTLQTQCRDERILPYKFKFIVYDDDCVKSDSTILSINIFVKSQVSAFPISGNFVVLDTSSLYTYSTISNRKTNYFWQVDSGKIISGQGDSVIIVKWNTINPSTMSCVFSNTSTSCTDTSYYKVWFFTGVDDTKYQNLRVFPNPANDKIQIQNLQTQDLSSIIIFNIQGEKIIEQRILKDGYIDISTLTKGVYIIKLGERVQRFVKL